MPRKKKIEFNNGKEKKDPKKKIVKRFAYYDADGKRKGKTFTAYSEAEMAMKVAEWNVNHTNAKKPSMTVLQAVEAYIEGRASVISPSTLRMYKSICKRHVEGQPISSINISAVSSPDVQAWVNTLAADVQGKTVKNCCGLLTSAIRMYNSRADIGNVKLPAIKRYDANTPDDKKIQALLNWLQEKDKEMYTAVLLAAFGPMRRSEVCALTSKDVKGNVVSVRRAMVPGPGGTWVTKDTPKTDASNRDIMYPEFVADVLRDIKGPIIQTTPDNLSHRFSKDVKDAGLEHFRFHDLRHYGASIMHALGVPDKYIIERGGWSSDSVMKRIYRDTLDAEKKKQTDAINAHFEGFCSKNCSKTS